MKIRTDGAEWRLGVERQVLNS